METLNRAIFLSILMLCMVLPIESQGQQGAPMGVDLECDQSTININVHPEQNEAVTMVCTVTNTGSFAENIDLDSSVDGNDFAIEILGDESYLIEAGEDEDFIVQFSASPGIEVKSEDYNISARVTSIGPEPFSNVPLGQFGSTAEVGGTVNSLGYSRIELDISNDLTRNIEVSETATIQFTIFNDGNRIDNLEVIIVNQLELEDAGFIFVSDSFFRATVNPGASSDQGTIILEAPADTSEEISIQVEIQAFSKIDTTAESNDTVRIVVEASSGGGAGSIGFDDFETMDGDGMAMIGMAVGGLFGVILLLVIISKLTKKAGKQKIAAKEASKAAKAERRSGRKSNKAQPVEDDDFEDDDLDFSDLDDLDDLDDDFDFEDI